MKNRFDINIIPENRLESILPLVDLLNNGAIPYELLRERLQHMIAMGSYKCIGIYEADELIGICGVWILNKFYVGKHIEPDNVFIKKKYRNQGVGHLLMEWLFEYAKEIDCLASKVNCYVENKKGNVFWESHGYQTVAFHKSKKI
ncbi:GNAT family N-acetyltransferase [Aggregatimonas sangjinii]|uniref:GNAT family N-acetyltransferase n=1 Tax=Aggregatimonas sangjinii TaxID=2583587 RepID=A0A5B7SMB8_9FLAO|nr:GNAT family N-acetyltransferase [Aggregatimonas sangjinii]QCW99814.1 GNAT family N-acetyltransferase [Aggregatimonas sangjinii]